LKRDNPATVADGPLGQAKPALNLTQPYGLFERWGGRA
jgi:hypothetical protein